MMMRLTLYTARYIALIEERFAIARKEGCGNDYALSIAWAGERDGWVQALMGLLEEVAILENAVYRYSSKMRALAKELRKTPMYINELERLKGFLRTNGSLHVEGYAAFRMGKYNEALDMLSYRLIKKMNLYAKGD
jgi:hypothetical protein